MSFRPERSGAEESPTGTEEILHCVQNDTFTCHSDRSEAERRNLPQRRSLDKLGMTLETRDDSVYAKSRNSKFTPWILFTEIFSFQAQSTFSRVAVPVSPETATWISLTAKVPAMSAAAA